MKNFIQPDRNRIYYVTSLALIFSVLFLCVYNPVQAQLVPLNRIGEAEQIIYGEIKQEQDIKDRIRELELTLFNSIQDETLVKRTEKILKYVFMEEGQSSLVFLLNAMEWSVWEQIRSGPIIERVKNMEAKLFEETSSSKGLKTRIDRLSKAVLSEKELPFTRVTVPTDTPIQVELTEKISSKKAQVGDKYRFKILNNVVVDGVLIIPENIRGTMRVKEVEKAGPLGKEGQLKLQILDVTAIDGSSIPVNLDIKEDKGEELSRGLAVGASLLAAVVLKHPLGLIAGYFVQGQSRVIPENTRFVLKTSQQEWIQGIVFK